MQSQTYSRKQRVADQINREIAVVLLTELNDPRARGLTVSGVDLSADMRMATVHICAHDHNDSAEIIKALQHASGYLRTRLAKRVRLKFLPKLQFRYDPSLDHSDRIEHLLRNALGPTSNGP